MKGDSREKKRDSKKRKRPKHWFGNWLPKTKLIKGNVFIIIHRKNKTKKV